MKQIVFLPVFNILLVTCAMGQSIAFTNNDLKAPVHFYFSAIPNKDTPGFRLSAESKAGFSITGLGIILGGAGIVIYNANRSSVEGGSHYPNEKIGASMWLVGGVIAIMGSVFSIDGSVHDLHRYYQEGKFSLISNGNDVGVAYNF